MLTGEYRHSVDAKNRLFIPAKHREELGEELIVARDLRGQLLKVFSLEGWNDYIAPIKQQERRVAEPALRYLHRNAAKVTPDSQGRILLPQALLDFAQIDKNAVIVATTIALRSGRRRCTRRKLSERTETSCARSLSCLGCKRWQNRYFRTFRCCCRSAWMH